MGKACLKRYVLSADLKEERVGETLMWEGREFQRVGAATEKARSPQVRSLVQGTCSRLAEMDLRNREGACCKMRRRIHVRRVSCACRLFISLRFTILKLCGERGLGQRQHGVLSCARSRCASVVPFNKGIPDWPRPLR